MWAHSVGGTSVPRIRHAKRIEAVKYLPKFWFSCMFTSKKKLCVCAWRARTPVSLSTEAPLFLRSPPMLLLLFKEVFPPKCMLYINCNIPPLVASSSSFHHRHHHFSTVLWKSRSASPPSEICPTSLISVRHFDIFPFGKTSETRRSSRGRVKKPNPI